MRGKHGLVHVISIWRQLPDGQLVYSEEEITDIDNAYERKRQLKKERDVVSVKFLKK